MNFLFTSVPAVLTSCPAIEGGRGMLILSPQRHSTGEGERSRKCHLSEEMGLRCVCLCVLAYASECACISKDQSDRLTDISCVFPILLSFHAEWNICICVGVYLLEQVANSKVYCTCVPMHLFYFGIFFSKVFPYPLLLFFKLIICLSIFLHSTAHSLHPLLMLKM